MNYSMTGFGKSQKNFENRNINIEIKSVNNRYCDISIKLYRKYSFLEEPIKRKIKEMIKRGKIDVQINIENLQSDSVEVSIDREIVKNYISEISNLSSELDIANNVDMKYLLSLPEVLKIMPKEDEEEEITSQVMKSLVDALEMFNSMRLSEGVKLEQDILNRNAEILKILQKIESLKKDAHLEYLNKIKERMKEILEGITLQTEERLFSEAAIFADKADITEEIVRQHSHIKQLEKIIKSEESEGRKLDFLLQEMNREANTIGSKANNLEITKLVLDMKSEIEKIREQCQNIE